jgi:hypothetical protein
MVQKEMRGPCWIHPALLKYREFNQLVKVFEGISIILLKFKTGSPVMGNFQHGDKSANF